MQESNTQNITYEVWKRRPIPFLDDFEKKWSNNGVQNGLHGAFGKETVEREDEQSQKVRGKTEKDFKNCPHYAKHAFFATEVSRQQDARSSRQNTQRQNFEKKFLSVFHKWKFHSRAEPRKSLCTPRDWTFHSRTSRQNWPTSSRLWHATWLTCDWVAKTGQKCFFFKFFFNFQFLKSKILSKST